MSQRLGCSMTRALGSLFLTAYLAFAAVTAHGQNASIPSFPSGVEFVNVNVSVLNGQDRFVTDLRREDFVVLEDGVKQDLALFAQKELPISLVMLLDMSASMTTNVKAVRSAARRLLRTLRPEDEAQIVQFNHGLTVLQAFTSDHDALDDAVAHARPGGSTALHNVLYITLKDLMRTGPSSELRRRAVVLLSDGEDTASMVTDDQVMELARAAEVNIYSIKIGAAPGSTQAPLGEQARYLLNALARESGGQAFFPEEVAGLSRIYDRIAQELQSQYSIGYVPRNPKMDGGWRQILVMTQREGVKLRHRLGYYAVPDGAPLRTTRSAPAAPSAPAHARAARLP